MCIAILNYAKTIDRSTFITCWENNPDGGGLAYVEDGEVKLIKEMHSANRLYKKYLKVRKNNLLPMILHFRIATSGYIDKDNCHPFEVRPGLVMAHNGILGHVDATPAVNDTRVFIEQVVKKLPADFLCNWGIQQLMSGYIDDSKLIFLDRLGMFHIINEDLGHWDSAHNNWFSNYSYEQAERQSFSYYGLCDYGYRSRHDKMHDHDWAMCEGCENWYRASEIEYDHSINAMLCEDCRSYFYNDYEQYNTCN